MELERGAVGNRNLCNGCTNSCGNHADDSGDYVMCEKCHERKAVAWVNIKYVTVGLCADCEKKSRFSDDVKEVDDENYSGVGKSGC